MDGQLLPTMDLVQRSGAIQDVIEYRHKLFAKIMSIIKSEAITSTLFAAPWSNGWCWIHIRVLRNLLFLNALLAFFFEQTRNPKKNNGYGKPLKNNSVW